MQTAIEYNAAYVVLKLASAKGVCSAPERHWTWHATVQVCG